MGIIRRLFGLDKVVEAVEGGGWNSRISEQARVLELERIAIQTGVGFLASAVSQCLFRTFVKGKEIRDGPEYYLWNYSPNRNQNSTEFLWEVVEAMIYDGEALVVEKNGQLFTADAYGSIQQGTQEWIYTGITVNGENLGDRRESQILRFRLDNVDIKPILSDICGQYEDLIGEAVEGYRKTYADKGVLEISSLKRGKIEDEKKYREDLVNNKFRTFFSNKSAVLPLYDGYAYTPQTKATRNTSEINDVKQLTDEVYNRYGQALRIPPAMLKGDAANMEGVLENFLCYGVKPICGVIGEEIVRKRYGEKAFREGSYLLVDMSSIELSSVFAASSRVEKMISSGVYSVDEIRQKIGEPLLGTPEAQEHYITKNFEKMKGGSQDE